MKIYVLAPSYRTGGPESLHQLVVNLRKNKFDAYVYYFEKPETTTVLYEKYVDAVRIANYIEDDKENIVVASEAHSGLLYQYKKSKKVIWWLSRDFYFRNLISEMYISFTKKHCIPEFIGKLLLPMYMAYQKSKCKYYSMEYTDFRRLDVFHLYNCEYEKMFLVENGVDEVHMQYLCGPIDKSYVVDRKTAISRKENFVTYNPKKVESWWIEKLQRDLRSKGKEIQFVRIEKMSQQEVKDTLLGAKVYVDFGYFPGPERIPREAALSFCNLVTSKQGAAGNNVDVPIPSKYKFDTTDECVSRATQTIVELLENYETHVQEFDSYREKALNQIECFEQSCCSMIDKVCSIRS